MATTPAENKLDQKELAMIFTCIETQLSTFERKANSKDAEVAEIYKGRKAQLDALYAKLRTKGLAL